MSAAGKPWYGARSDDGDVLGSSGGSEAESSDGEGLHFDCVVGVAVLCGKGIVIRY